MSMFGGLTGGDSSSYKPQEAPKPPKRSDAKVDKHGLKYYRKLKEKDSYSQTLLGGSAAQPTKSYTAQLFGTGTASM